jgi:Na+/H+-dicarboxylate symporter
MPIGMFSWMCVEAIEMQSPKDQLTQIAWFFVTTFIAFVVHLFILWPGIYFLILQKNPFRFYINMLPAIVVAFGSASRFNFKFINNLTKNSNKVTNIFLVLSHFR